MSQRDDFRGLLGDKDCYTVKANLLPPVTNHDVMAGLDFTVSSSQDGFAVQDGTSTEVTCAMSTLTKRYLPWNGRCGSGTSNNTVIRAHETWQSS